MIPAFGPLERQYSGPSRVIFGEDLSRSGISQAKGSKRHAGDFSVPCGDVSRRISDSEIRSLVQINLFRHKQTPEAPQFRIAQVCIFQDDKTRKYSSINNISLLNRGDSSSLVSRRYFPKHIVPETAKSCRREWSILAPYLERTDFGAAI